MARPRSFSVEHAVDVVTELYLERGYLALSMREVAEFLNLSRTSIYGT